MDQIQTVNQVIKSTAIPFIDYEEAFDSVETAAIANTIRQQL